MEVKELKEYLEDCYDHKDVMVYIKFTEENIQPDRVVDNSKRLKCYETDEYVVITNLDKLPKGAL